MRYQAFCVLDGYHGNTIVTIHRKIVMSRMIIDFQWLFYSQLSVILTCMLSVSVHLPTLPHLKGMRLEPKDQRDLAVYGNRRVIKILCVRYP